MVEGLTNRKNGMIGGSGSGKGGASGGSYQFSKSGPNLTSSFFRSVEEQKSQKGMGGFSDLSQRQYLIQCNQRSQTGETLIPQLAETDLKIDRVKRC